MLSKNLDILLVEDTSVYQLLIKHYLQGYEPINLNVIISETLEQAVQQIKENHFDAILVDLTLPDSIGYETFTHIYQQTQDIPIIILTSLDDREVSAKAVRMGAQDYLIKDEHLPILLVRSILYGVERQRSKQQQIKLAKSETRVNTLKQFLRDISHDLNNPLSIIMSSGQLLERYIDTNNHQAHKHINQILSQTDNLTHMIESILEMSKLNFMEELDPTHVRPINLCMVAKQSTQNIRHIAHQQSIEFHVHKNIDQVIIQADEAMIFRVIDILIQNALDHTPPSGEIHLNLTQKHHKAILQVKDNGSGIPFDQQPYIFDHFYRTDEARHSQNGNSGMGLAIAKRIVELHHGTIDVHSEVNQGTQFTISLPTISDRILT